MKELFAIFFLITSIYGSNIQVEQKIYNTILDAVFPDNDHIYVWTDVPTKAKLLESIVNVKIVDTPEEADFLILNHTRNIKTNALKFASSYKMLKYY